MSRETVVLPNGRAFAVVDSSRPRNDADAPAIASSTKKRNKYNAQAVVVDGVRFASKAEGARYVILRNKLRNGDIYDLKTHPRFPITVNDEHICDYEADFSYLRRGVGRRTVEDVKGVKTPVFRLKWKLVQAIYPHHDWRLS